MTLEYQLCRDPACFLQGALQHHLTDNDEIPTACNVITPLRSKTMCSLWIVMTMDGGAIPVNAVASVVFVTNLAFRSLTTKYYAQTLDKAVLNTTKPLWSNKA